MTTSIKLLTRIIMIGCRKGDVTKTTTTVNLSYELSQFGKKILVLDFDGQTTRLKRPFGTAVRLLKRKCSMNQ